MKLNYKNIIITGLLYAAVVLKAMATDPVVYSAKVLDSNGNPLIGVVVSDENGNILTYSDKNGYFSISTEEAKLNLVYDGFSSYLVDVTKQTESIYLESDDDDDVVDIPKMINLPFGALDKNRISGAVTTIDVPNELNIDNRTSIGSALNGKVAGLFYSTNVRGLGNAVVIVDGVPRDIGAYNLTEIESITVLKDAMSRSLYGAQADQGVILVTTRRGVPGEPKMRVRTEFGMQTPVLMPDYLGSADYMEKYNEAAANDGLLARYTQTQIDNTRAGTNPILNPDEDFFDNRFLKDQTTYMSANVDATGGNDFGTYFANIGISSSNELYQLGGNDIGNKSFNARANTNFKINDMISMKSDIVTVIGVNKTPVANYWNLASTQLPNSYPVFIPLDSVSNAESLFGAKLVDGNKLLGGTQEFQTNLYGEVDRQGSQTFTTRLVQFNAGLDFDFDKHIPGLTASTLVSFDFLNYFIERQAANYAIYQPSVIGSDLSVTKIGQDFVSTQNSTVPSESYAHRRFGFFGTVSYKKEIGDGDLDVVSVAYLDRLDAIGQEQPAKHLHYGLRANYIHNNKYILEFAGTILGSQKLTVDNQYAFSPTVGAGWILSNEDFFNAVDFLKIKGSYGILKNDNWNGNFLQESYFQVGGNYNYNNGVGANSELNIVNVGSNIDWQKRDELNLGFELGVMNSDLQFEVNYFRSKSYDNVTNVSNSTPSLVGYDLYDNFNGNTTSGVDAAINYTKSFGDLVINVGTYFVYAKNVIDQIDEPIYVNAPYRQRAGSDGWAYMGYVSDGLYGPEDFNTDGSLVSGVTSTFGSIQAGDIKYQDLNGDNIINQDDQRIIGSTFPSINYSMKLNIRYKGFGFYALGTGNIGDDALRNNSYFWVYGDRKYSAMVNQAYGPNNQNTNAIMPRMSTSFNNNNYRTSDYWLYDNDLFTIPIIQLSYTYDPSSKYFDDLTLFVKGNNLVRINKNGDWNDLRIGSAPINQGFSIGLSGNF